LVDEYYDRYRNFFAVDDDACCAQLPDADETVFVSRCNLLPYLYSYLV
jgi:hypothetical protein